MLDPHTGEVRPSTKADVAATALMVDYLSDVDVYERAVGVHDVPPAVGQIHNVEAWMANTTKHGFNGPFDGFQLKKIVDMAASETCSI
jgi:trimethylamine--corrinoid protein Co-methyltransferase